MSYKCQNCNYSTKFFSDIKKHISMKKTCIIKDCPELNMDQLIILSLLPCNFNIDNEKIQNIKNIQCNKKLLFDVLDHKNKKECSLCNKFFDKTEELREHILLECFQKEMCKTNQEQEQVQESDGLPVQEQFQKSVIESVQSPVKESVIESVIESPVKESVKAPNKKPNKTPNKKITPSIPPTNNDPLITTSTTSTTFTTTVNPSNTAPPSTPSTPSTPSNSSFKPVPFEESWDLSHLNTFQKKYNILYCDIMYTTLLHKILENKSNLNVIMDSKQNIGLVYLNDTDKFVQMKIEVITRLTMDKLNMCLLDINNSINENPQIFQLIHKISEDRINNKLNDYIKIPETKKNVDAIMADIFDNKKLHAYEASMHIIEAND